jgi:hypothetical protein
MDTRRATIAFWLAAVSAPALVAPVGAQDQKAAEPPPTRGVYRGVSKAVRFDISPPLRDIVPQPLSTIEKDGPRREGASGLEGPLGPQQPDGAVQSRLPEGVVIPAPSVTFDTFTGTARPPDPVGDIGPNHYVAMANSRFAIYSRTGTLLFGPVNNNTLWAGFGGACQQFNSGDPVVLHDQLADRWILTQFTATAEAGTGFFYNCVAVSTSPDPTGTYFRWAFTTGANFPDYPKYGVWSDALYMSTREFLGSAGPFQGVGAYAINRAQLVAGNPTPQMISFVVPPGATPYNVGDGLLPADLDGTVPPPPGTDSYWAGTMDQGGPYGAPQDAINIWRYHADFVTPPSSSFTLTTVLPVATFDSIYPCTPTSRNCIPQPGVAQNSFIDILSYRQRPTHRLAYRNFGTHEALVTNQSVEAGPSMAGVRWYEIRNTAGTISLFQQGTFAPGLTDGIHRWMGSIAMDRAGNMGLAYSASSATTTFPSLFYTGRLVTDTAGQMPQGEGSFVNGTGAQTTTNAAARWGDYTSINMDPVDDCTFWYINQHFVAGQAGNPWTMRVGAFRFPAPQCIPVPVELQSFEIKD